MISLYDGQVLNLLAPNYRADPEVQALSFAIQQGMRTLLNYAARAAVYTDIDNMREDALDLLAAEICAQYYEAGYPLETKRALVRQAIRWHEVAGTVAGVEELASQIFQDCRVEEWSSYGGNPFCFRVITQALAGADDVARFNRLLSGVKNLRSHLDSVSILRVLETPGSHDISIRVTVAELPAIHCIF